MCVMCVIIEKSINCRDPRVNETLTRIDLEAKKKSLTFIASTNLVVSATSLQIVHTATQFSSDEV